MKRQVWKLQVVEARAIDIVVKLHIDASSQFKVKQQIDASSQCFKQSR